MELKILNSEINYPEIPELNSDYSILIKSSKEDAIEFRRIIKKLAPIIAPAPSISSLCALFNAQRSEGYYKRGVVNLAIHHILKIQDTILFYIPNKLIERFTSDSTLTSFIMKSIGEFMRTNPTYEEYYDGVSRILATLSGRSEAPNVAILSKEFFSEYKESYLAVLQIDLPKILEENAVFRDAITFNLTIAIALLKKIIKFSEAKTKTFLEQHYIALKKGRNDLIHGNYIRESFKESPNEVIYYLYSLMNELLADLNNIFIDIKKSEESKAWAQVAIAHTFFKSGGYVKSSIESIVSKITDLAFPNTYTTSEKNLCFKSSLGFAGKFFKTLKPQNASRGTSTKVTQEANAVKECTRKSP